MPVPPAGHSSSDSTSSYTSSKVSLPTESFSSQSDLADSLRPSMSRSDASAYAVAATSQPAFRANSPVVVSAGQKFKRAFGKRRKPSRDAASLLSSGDEHSTADAAQPAASSQALAKAGVANHSSSHPSAVKLTMHLFGGRKASHLDHDQPPPLPPKPVASRRPTPPPLQNQRNTANMSSVNSEAAKRSSIIMTSPSINPAIQFMQEDELRQRERPRLNSPTEIEQNKEDWRKSDSTVASNDTLRAPPPPPPENTSSSTKRNGALLTSPIPALASGTNAGSGIRSPASDASISVPASNAGNQAKRRSLSLTIPITPSQSSQAASFITITPGNVPAASSPAKSVISESHSTSTPHSSSHSVSLTPALHDMPTLTRTAANGVMHSSAVSGSPVNKSNIRGRLAAWTSTSGAGTPSTSPLGVSSVSSPSLSSPSATSLNQDSYNRIPFVSTATKPWPDLQAIAAVREISSRTRSPSTSSVSPAGIRQAATSFTSGASAMALGFGKRAYEKVGRVLAGGSSGSETEHHHYSPGMASSGDEQHKSHHGPSAFLGNGRRTQNAPSGTWSVTSLSGGSRSSSEREGRKTPPNALGKLVRPPRNTVGGIVFGRELSRCVLDTRATIPVNHPLFGRMIPALVFRCAQHLHKWGVQEEGLFRISGRSKHINILRAEFDNGADHDIIDCSPSDLDPHAVASLFKAYLRELPEPILTRSLSPLFDNAMNVENSLVSSIVSSSAPKPGSISSSAMLSENPAIRKPPSLSTFALPNSASLRAPSTTLVEALGDLVARLPRENRDLLLTVVELMQATAKQSKETKMPLSNLLLVFCPSLGMGPTLLRVLCDSHGIWERAQELHSERAATPTAARDEGEVSDDSDSDSVSSYGEAQAVDFPLPPKSVEVEPHGESNDVPTNLSATPDDVKLPQARDPDTSLSSRPRVIRRVPVPALSPEKPPVDSTSPSRKNPTTTLTSSPLSETPPRPSPISTSVPPLQVPSRSMTPLSAVSLTSAPPLESNPTIPPPRNRQFSSPLPSSGFISIHSAPDHNKDLPASPRTPALPEPDDRANDDRASSTPPLHIITDDIPKRKSRTLAPLLSSHSAPSVVFPSIKTPTTPSSFKKHAISFSSVRQAKVSSDKEDSPSRATHTGRRPSLNLLFNIRRSGSPSPSVTTPIISSPIPASIPIPSSPSSVASSPRTVTDPLPPVLSLPSFEADTNAGLGLGWDDVFSTNSASGTTSSRLPTQVIHSAPHSPQSLRPQGSQPTLFSAQSSRSTPISTHPSTPQRSTMRFGGFFSTSGPPVTASVQKGTNVGPSAKATSLSRDGGANPTVTHEDSSSGPDSPEVESPMKDTFTPPPHISFQLRRSSMEEEDWATAVLKAAGKPAEPLA